MANAVNRVIVGDRTIMSLLDADAIDPSELKQGLSCYDKTGHRIVGSAQIFETPTIYKSPLNGTDEFHTSVKQYRVSNFDGYVYDTKEYFEKYVAYVGTINPINVITQLFLNCRIKFPEYESAEYNIQQGQVTLNFNLDTLYIYDFYYNSAYKNSNLNAYRMNICSHGRFPIENIRAEFYVHYSDGTNQTVIINPSNALSITFVKNNSEEYNRYKVTNNLNFDIQTPSGKTINQIAIQSLKFSVSGDDGQFFNEGTSVDTRGLDEQSNIVGYANDNTTGFYLDNSLTIPIGDSSIKFYINSSKQLVAEYKKNNDLVVQGANDNMYANGVNILQIFYLSNTAIFIMYNWRNGASTSLTTLNSNTVGKIIFIKHDDKLGMTAERIMFGGTKTFENSAVNGSVYAGKIFPLDFKEGAEWKIGIQYIRDSITNTNVYNGRYSYFGRINFYVGTSVSRIMMQTVSTSVISNIASCIPSTGANVWFANTFGNIVNHYSMTSNSVITRKTYMTRVANNVDSASGNYIDVNNTNGFGDVEPSVLGNMIFNQQMLGRLEDGTYLFCRPDKSAIMGGVPMYFEVWECLFDTVANHSVWIKKNSFFDLQSVFIEKDFNIKESPYILLKNNVLLDTHDGTLYQIMYGKYNKNGTTETGYYPKFIGRSNYIENKKATCKIREMSGDYLLRPYQSYSIPTGQYSNLFGGIGCSQIVK